MYYDKRNRATLNELADNTKKKAYQWYNYCIENNIEILIYEAIRTKKEQQDNVNRGVSKTLRYYHLVGQALDFVPVKNGKAVWNGYKAPDIQKAFAYARSIGFVLGHDWGWDSPHLQFEHKGYGTDTFGKIKVETEGLTVSQYNEIMKRLDGIEKALKNKMDIQAPRKAGTSHATSWQKATSNKVVNGENPQNFVTREQMTTILDRLNLIKG